MTRPELKTPTNPYHYILRCIGGKWKMTILHEIHIFGKIKFNRIQRVLPISKKILTEQLKELIEDGLIKRIEDRSSSIPNVDYILTENGAKLVPSLDMLYIWAIRNMDANHIPIDCDAFVVHNTEKYVKELNDIMIKNGYNKDHERHIDPKK